MDFGERRLRVAVVGAGGIGGLMGGMLARQPENEVTFVATESTAAALNSKGLRVNSDHYRAFSVAVRAVTRLTAPVDVCVVAVKAMQLRGAMERVSNGVVAGSVVVPFLNGVEHVETLRQMYGDVVAPGTVRVASTRSAPGVIEHSSPFFRVELAISDSLGVKQRAAALAFAQHLIAVDAEVELRDDELSMLWGKLIFLAPLALLTTRYDISAGGVRTAHREELVAVINEIAQVGHALGASLSAPAGLEFFDSVPGAMQSSMQQDAAAGNPIELDGIGEAVLRAATRTGVVAPVTQRLVVELRQRAGARGSVR
jgi:2-dehydropantoate 2-reductase